MKRLVSIPASTLPRSACSTRNTCPPHAFEQITDILAEMVLEDIKQYPRIPTSPPIDSFSKQANTSLPRQEGGE